MYEVSYFAQYSDDNAVFVPPKAVSFRHLAVITSLSSRDHIAIYAIGKSQRQSYA